MTDTEKLLRDIQSLRESIQIDWVDLDSNPLRKGTRIGGMIRVECGAAMSRADAGS
jgi:hypothetical protein